MADTVTADIVEGSDAGDDVPITVASELGVGAKLGAYEIIAPIASGGMGRVWLCARHGDFGFSRTFALKTMREDLASDPDFRRMFLAEAKLAARVRHTNVVEMVDLGEADGVAYQVMTWVEGASLFGLVKRSQDEADKPKPSVGVALRIVIDILRGLHAAHELRGEDGTRFGLVHRDVSPQNVLVGLDGVAKITDFGVAKATAGSGHSSLDGVVGKPRFMAPEQLTNGVVDRRSDVYATGVILWELLSGARSVGFGADLVQGKTAPALPNAQELPLGVPAIVARALAEKAADRPATAAEMAEALDTAAAAAGIVLSSSSVSSWVANVAGPEIRSEQESLAREVERTRLTRAATAASIAPSGPKRRLGFGIVAGGAALVLAAVAIVHFTRPQTPVTQSSPTIAALAPTTAPIDPPAPTAPGSVSVPIAPAESSAQPAASAAHSATHAHAAAHPPKPRPKYGNPYGP